jgi:hypothetical protein
VIGVPKATIDEIHIHTGSESEEAPLSNTWLDPVSRIEFIWIGEGCFQPRYAAADTAAEVCLDGFWMSRQEVTNAQFRLFRPDHDSGALPQGHTLNADNQPAVRISQSDAEAFARWLSGQNGQHFIFRLPRETEWEFACRAGKSTTNFWGNDIEQACYYGNFKDLSWRTVDGQNASPNLLSCYDGYVASAPVRSFQPNGYGLYDMAGNAAEWCREGGVARGSSYASGSDRAGLDRRLDRTAGPQLMEIGFRLVMVKSDVGGLEIVETRNVYGGPTKSLRRVERDVDFVKGVRKIQYYFDAENEIVKKEIQYNKAHGAQFGIQKKVLYSDKQEIFYSSQAAAARGYNLTLTFHEHRPLRLHLKPLGGDE